MNFIFFMPDEMRAESVSCYGHPLVKMPNYDRLAAEGVRFDQCHIQHPVCSPSRCSMMTGRYPHVRGHRTLWHLLRPDEPSLFQYLKEAGYHIEWYGKNDLYSEESFPQAVDHYGWRGAGHAGPPVTPFGEPGYYSFLSNPSSGTCEETSDYQNTAGAMEFLRSEKSKENPFLVYLPLSMPHPAYGAPEPYHSMYDPDDVPPFRPVIEDGKPQFHDLIRQYRELDKIPEETLKKIQAVYLGMNSYMDWVLGELLKCLEETGHAEDTAIFVLSDHGDWAGDFGLVEKWPSALDDTMTRVPFLARVPGNKAGHVVNEQVEMFDLMATTMELAGVEARHTHFAESLVDQLHGAPGDPDRAVFAEGGYDGDQEAHCLEGKPGGTQFARTAEHIYYPKCRQQQEHPESVCRATMIRTLTHKLIRRTNGEHELYDLVNDPQELRNLYSDVEYLQVRMELEDRMLTWYGKTSDVTPYDENPRGLPLTEQ